MGETLVKRFYNHPQAIVESQDIGERTKIWAFSHICKGVSIGRDCNIGEGCYLEPGVKIGNMVTVKNGVCLWEGVVVEDNVFIGPNAVFTNDLYPRSKNYNKKRIKTLLKRGATIGANATIMCGVEIGRYAMVGGGAVVTKDVADYGLVYGNPAILKGYVCECGKKLKIIKKDYKCACGRRYYIDNMSRLRMRR